MASVLLELFVMSRRDSEGEPGVLWLLFCAVMAAGLAIVADLGWFFWKGDRTSLFQAFQGTVLAGLGTAAWFLKRQARNRGFLLLNERFRTGPSTPAQPQPPPSRLPGQVFWILSYRTVLGVAMAGAVGAFLMNPAHWVATGALSNLSLAASGNPQEKTEPASSETSKLEVSSGQKPVSTALVDPTKAEIPSAELSAVAAMATAASAPASSSAAGGGMEEGNTPAAGPAPAPGAAMPVVAVPAAPAANSRPVSRNSIYFSKIRPILARSCVSCHGPSKQKGDLRLDTPDALRAGVNGKPVIAPGNPAKSRLYIVTGLPLDDTDRMPPKGNPLSVSDRELLAGWIKNGADLGDGVSIPAGKDGVFLVDSIAETLPEPDPKLLEALKAEHVVIRPLSKNGHVLEMDFSHSDRARADLKLAELAPIALNIYALDFSRTNITDADLARLAPMKNLARLLLSRTGISDAGLAQLKTNTALEQLNLYNTSVTDGGLNALADLKSLKKVYLWKSKATTAGAKSLENQVPGLVVSMGE
ncbi:MAG: hypothetical protein JWM59_2795 [Verrucomicrobiales bacterium]|nr:hypothetical protein [Verrucomicrobiales bacterium]